MPETIEIFLKREVGPGGLKFLAQFCAQNGIENIEDASKDVKLKFMADIQPELNQISFTKAQFLSSEMMSILQLKDKTIKGDEADLIKKKAIKKFLNTQAEDRMVKSFAKIDAIFNLFWSKAAKTVDLGVHISTIHQKCNQILGWLKTDLFSICDELESNLGIDTSSKQANKVLSGFNFTNSSLAVKEEESPYRRMFSDFRARVEASYQEFYDLFMKSMDQDIELAKAGKSDEELIQKTKVDTARIWKEIVDEYEDLKNAINSMIADQ